MLRRKSVSPAKRTGVDERGDQQAQLPGVWPGVWRMAISMAPARTVVLSTSAAVHVCTHGDGGAPQRGLYPRKDIVEKAVTLVNARGGPRRALELGRAPDVIEVRVRVHDGVDRSPREPAGAPGSDRSRHPGFDDDGTLGVEVGDDGAIATERSDRQRSTCIARTPLA